MACCEYSEFSWQVHQQNCLDFFRKKFASSTSFLTKKDDFVLMYNPKRLPVWGEKRRFLNSDGSASFTLAVSTKPIARVCDSSNLNVGTGTQPNKNFALVIPPIYSPTTDQTWRTSMMRLDLLLYIAGVSMRYTQSRSRFSFGFLPYRNFQLTPEGISSKI